MCLSEIEDEFWPGSEKNNVGCFVRHMLFGLYDYSFIPQPSFNVNHLIMIIPMTIVRKDKAQVYVVLNFLNGFSREVYSRMRLFSCIATGSFEHGNAFGHK